MHILLAVIMGAAGLIAGFFVPQLAQAAAAYKYAQRGRVLAADRRCTGIPAKTGCAVFSMAGWALAGLPAGHATAAVLLPALIWTASLLVGIVDARTRIIPNEAVAALAVLGAVFQLVYCGVPGLLWALVCMAAVMAVFSLLAFAMGGHAVGAGDVKLAGAMGLTLGYPHILHGLVAMGALLAVFSFIGFYMKKITLRSMVPFAPFLLAGLDAAILAVLFHI